MGAVSTNFKDMKVGTDVVDLQSASSIPDYHAYRAVCCITECKYVEESLVELCD